MARLNWITSCALVVAVGFVTIESAAGQSLPLSDGRYALASDLKWCGDPGKSPRVSEGAFFEIKRNGRNFEVGEGVCDVKKVVINGDIINYKASCEAEGEAVVISDRIRIIDLSTFVDGKSGRTYRKCKK